MARYFEKQIDKHTKAIAELKKEESEFLKLSQREQQWFLYCKNRYPEDRVKELICKNLCKAIGQDNLDDFKTYLELFMVSFWPNTNDFYSDKLIEVINDVIYSDAIRCFVYLTNDKTTLPTFPKQQKINPLTDEIFGHYINMMSRETIPPKIRMFCKDVYGKSWGSDVEFIARIVTEVSNSESL